MFVGYEFRKGSAGLCPFRVEVRWELETKSQAGNSWGLAQSLSSLCGLGTHPDAVFLPGSVWAALWHGASGQADCLQQSYLVSVPASKRDMESPFYSLS